MSNLNMDTGDPQIRLSYGRKLRRTIEFCSAEWARTAVALVVLFGSSFAMAAVFFAILPNPEFLTLTSSGGEHPGVAAIGWSIMCVVSGIMAGLFVDEIGYKRVLSFGLILSLFALLLMAGAVSLQHETISSPLFWIAATIGCLTLSAVFIASLGAAATFTQHPISLKLTLSLCSLVIGAAFASAGIVHTDGVRGAVSRRLAESVPVLEHQETTISLVASAAVIGLTLFAIPFVKKNRHLESESLDNSRCRLLRPLRILAPYQLMLFCFMWVGAQSTKTMLFHAMPHYASRALDISFEGGHFTAIVFGASAVLGPVFQILLTNANPIGVIATGALIASLGQACLIFSDPSMLGMPAIAIALVLISIGDAIWWPRMLSYAVLCGKIATSATHLSIAYTTWWFAAILSSTISPLWLQAYCPSAEDCNGILFWTLPAAISLGQSLLALAVLKFTVNADVRKHWPSTLKISAVGEFEMEPVFISDSSSDEHESALVQLQQSRGEKLATNSTEENTENPFEGY